MKYLRLFKGLFTSGKRLTIMFIIQKVFHFTSKNMTLVFENYVCNTECFFI